MKRIWIIIVCFIVLLSAYSIFLKIVPLKKSIFATNNERVEEFLYGRRSTDVVIAGSSLSGMFQERDFFQGRYFDLYLPFTGSCSALEVLRLSKKIPKILFVEINHIDRGTDSILIHQSFDEPFFSLKYALPFLQKKNQLIPNLIDRVKKPKADINDIRPPMAFYDSLLLSAQREWKKLPDSIYFNRQFAQLKSTLGSLSARGCRICFYEMPMDSSLRHAPLIVYQRKAVQKFLAENTYDFIPLDSSRVYQTGDGVHLLKKDADIYFDYFKGELQKKTRLKL